MKKCQTEEERKIRRKLCQKRYYESHKEIPRKDQWYKNMYKENTKKWQQNNKERRNELARNYQRKNHMKEKLEKYMPIAEKLYSAIKYENLSFDDFLDEILKLSK